MNFKKIEEKDQKIKIWDGFQYYLHIKLIVSNSREYSFGNRRKGHFLKRILLLIQAKNTFKIFSHSTKKNVKISNLP